MAKVFEELTNILDDIPHDELGKWIIDRENDGTYFAEEYIGVRENSCRYPPLCGSMRGRTVYFREQ